MKHPINLTGQDFLNNTHQQFAWLRREAPVYHARLNRWQRAYIISRYHDIQAIMKDPRFIKDPNTASGKGNNMMKWVPKTFQILMKNMLNSDEPNHRRLRNLIHKAFTPRMIRQLAPRIENIAQDLLQEAKKAGEFDLVEAFALPLPLTVIAEMIGIPPEDRHQFRYWTERIVMNPTPINLMRAIPAVKHFLDYIRQLAAKRAIDPKEDLLTALVQAEHEGDSFTEDELLAMVFLLLLAGHETTVNLITNGTLALIQHPDQLALLREKPELMETAVEEFLRYDGPLYTTEMSFAKEAITLHNVTMPAGSLILPALLSGNRDEAAFENPDTFDITRTPNRHLAFGQGIHYCLGAPLARLEAKIAFCALLEHSQNLRLTVPASTLEYKRVPLIHSLKTLPVAF